jgi:hypothetical protein
MLLELPPQPCSQAMLAATIANTRRRFVIFVAILVFNPASGLNSSLSWARIDAPEIVCRRA